MFIHPSHLFFSFLISALWPLQCFVEYSKSDPQRSSEGLLNVRTALSLGIQGETDPVSLPFFLILSVLLGSATSPGQIDARL